jgi:beta-lactamase regulating signal transducer with metallopeptidase domain/thiol-disulfide isomerase/thioredoxin/protocatechuate 3,4-dioxygenase beta subunit
MSAFAIISEAVAHLSDAGTGPVLVAKWTLLLALAWLAHAALAGRNPRWRVALWRGAMLGVGLIVAFSLVPPIVRYPIGPPWPRHPAQRQEPLGAPFRVEPSPPTGVVSPPVPSGTMERISIAPVTQAEHSPDQAAIRRLTEPVPTPAPSVVAGPLPSLVFRLATSWVQSIWLAGMLVLTARLILAARVLDRLVRRSSDVPDDIARECRVIAAHLGCTPAVRVVRSAEVATPCLAGLLRPVLLLPGRDDQGQDDLPAILAHELAHARHHDLAWNLAAHLASIVLWFHPLAWRIRSAHAAACDAVSDAVAADYLGDVVLYGRTLARLALRTARPAPAHVLAMARTPDVLRRLEALNRRIFQNPLGWKRAVPALLAGGLLSVLIAGFGFTHAERAAKPADGTEQAARSAAEQTPGKLTVRAVEAATDQPIQGVSIDYWGRFNETKHKGTVATGKDGRATIDYPPNAHIEYFEITARKPGLVPICIRCDDRRHPLELPASKELRFEPGTTIGGTVKDQAGQPIAGARVQVYAPPTECEAASNVFSLGALDTDAQGRWRLDVAPRGLGGVFLQVEHPRFRRGGGDVSRNLDSVIVLTKGLTVTGRVVDAANRPVVKARVFMGRDYFLPDASIGTTNERGEFTLENCNAGATIVTVQAEGFAPQIRDVLVDERTAPVVVTLSEPGGTIRGKVIDIEGKPIVGAFFGLESWRGHRSFELRLRTDKDGRFEWRSAPRDAVVFGAFKSGYMSSGHVPLMASDREQVITLHPELVITGRVTDAETGQPLPKFRLIRGNKHADPAQILWADNEAVEIVGGRYTTRFDQPWEPFFLRVEAPGYQPAVSRAFRSTEKSQTFDFALRRGGEVLSVSGVIVLPDGKPAPRAEVVLAREMGGYLMQAGYFDRRASLPTTTTDAEGRFTFSSPDDKCVLIAASDAGYATASPDELAKSDKMVLQPWGKIEGELRIGGQPGADQQVEFQPDAFQRGGRWYLFTYGYTTSTDGRGRFMFDRVVPGRGTAWRVIPVTADRPTNPGRGWPEPVEVKPGQTARVQVGGKGRTVIGRVVLDGKPETPVDWTQNVPLEIQDSPLTRLAYANLDRDGGFRIDDLPPGRYRLQMRVSRYFNPQASGATPDLGWLQKDLDMPEAPAGRPGEPLDLGAITARLFLKASDVAPDFNVERLAGKGKGDRLRLGDERGKLVLIDFWATWCGPCMAEMPALKDIQKTFGADRRFRLIGISCDQTAEPVLRVIRENGLTWTHGFAGGDFGSGVMVSYGVRAIPSTFLIGPDGRILARDLRGDALKEAVAKALKDGGLFAGGRPLP